MDRKTCFLVCPIGENGSEIRRRSDDLLELIIEPVCNESGYDIVIAYKILANDRINDSIMKYLNESELVIDDVSQNNANVFYELGYRTATGKPIIQISAEGTALPFDVYNIRTHFYDIDNTKKINSFKKNLFQVIQSIEQNEEMKVQEELQKRSNEVFTPDFMQFMTSAILQTILKEPKKLKELKDYLD